MPADHTVTPPAESVAAAFGASRPVTGDLVPCNGYWRPRCRTEESRYLRKDQRFPRCRRKHAREMWNLDAPGDGPGGYGRPR
ncbi:hypothetical protein [Actinoplanes sp. NPDC051851]|uniref:hypothetical protein n=1 Tax=Actinoplanes sp. NPDC051851 TaxID=3154753 RepID=UPI0034193C1F